MGGLNDDAEERRDEGPHVEGISARKLGGAKGSYVISMDILAGAWIASESNSESFGIRKGTKLQRLTRRRNIRIHGVAQESLKLLGLN